MLPNTMFKFNKIYLLVVFILFSLSLLFYLTSSFYEMHKWADTPNLFGNLYEIKNNRYIYQDVFVHRGPVYFFFLDFISFFIELKISNIIYYYFIHIVFCILSIFYLLNSIKIDFIKQFLIILIFLIFLLSLGLDSMIFQIFNSGLMFIFLGSIFNLINKNKPNLNILVISMVIPLILFCRIDGFIYCGFIFLLNKKNIFRIIIFGTLFSILIFYLLSNYYNFNMQDLITHSVLYNFEYRGPGPFNILYPKTDWIIRLFLISLIFNYIVFYKNKKIDYLQTIILNTHMIIAGVTFFLLLIINFIKYLIKEGYKTLTNNNLFDAITEAQIIFLKKGVVYLQYALVIIFLILIWRIFKFYSPKYKINVKSIFCQTKVIINDKIEIILLLIFLLEIAKFTLNNISWPSSFLVVVILPFIYLMKNNDGKKSIIFYKKLNLFISIIIFGFTTFQYQKVFKLETNITNNYNDQISIFENFIKDEKIDYILGSDAHFYKIYGVNIKNIVYFDQHLLRYDLDLTKYKTAKFYSKKLKKLSNIKTKIIIPCFYLTFDSINIRLINNNFTKTKEFYFPGLNYCVLENFIK